MLQPLGWLPFLCQWVMVSMSAGKGGGVMKEGGGEGYENRDTAMTVCVAALGVAALCQ